MSYDLALHDPITDAVLESDKPHQLRGGTYALGGTTRLELNVTYNYARHYYRVFGDDGIRTIYGMTGAASLPVLAKAINQLGYDVSDDYWAPTEGNAKQALLNLLILATMGLHGVWKGD